MAPALRIALALLALAAACSAQCFFAPLTLEDPGKPPKGCVDSEGKPREFGSEWVAPACLQCSCSTDGISCCAIIPTAVELPPQCEMLVNEKSCTYKIVMKADPDQECVPEGDQRIVLTKRK